MKQHGVGGGKPGLHQSQAGGFLSGTGMRTCVGKEWRSLLLVTAVAGERGRRGESLC